VSKAFTRRVFAWLAEIKTDRRMRPATFLVAYEIGQHFNAKYGGEAWPGYQTIADATGVSKRTVIRMVRLLVAGGYLKVERGSAGRGQSNRYWMTAPKGAPAHLFGAREKGASEARKGAPGHLNYLEPSSGAPKGAPNRERESALRASDPPMGARAVEGGAPNEEGKQNATRHLPMKVDRFAELRAAWPRPWIDNDEEEARSAFARACEEGAEPDEIIAGARTWGAAVDARYLPKLTAWLIGRGWTKPPPPKRARRGERQPSLVETMRAVGRPR